VVVAGGAGGGVGAAAGGVGAGFAAGVDAGAALAAAAPPVEPPPAAAAVAALSIPPCPLQDPRPPCGEVVPSLQVTGLLVSANAFAPGRISNAADARPHIQEAYFRIFIEPPSTCGGRAAAGVVERALEAIENSHDVSPWSSRQHIMHLPRALNHVEREAQFVAKQYGRCAVNYTGRSCLAGCLATANYQSKKPR
jgi:hypothetical protein